MLQSLVRQVIPYLLRRAQENSDLLHGGVALEIALLQSELRSRLLGGVGAGTTCSSSPR